MGIFDTDFDKYTEDAVGIFSATGLSTTVQTKVAAFGLMNFASSARK
jgi:hypothetical protein